MIPGPKARPKWYRSFQSPGLCFQNLASMGWGYQFRAVISWLLISLFQVNHQNGSMILSVNHSNGWNRNKTLWQWTVNFPIIFVHWYLEDVKRLAYTVPGLLIPFLDFWDASTKMIINLGICCLIFLDAYVNVTNVSRCLTNVKTWSLRFLTWHSYESQPEGARACCVLCSIDGHTSGGVGKCHVPCNPMWVM